MFFFEISHLLSHTILDCYKKIQTAKYSQSSWIDENLCWSGEFSHMKVKVEIFLFLNAILISLTYFKCI